MSDIIVIIIVALLFITSIKIIAGFFRCVVLPDVRREAAQRRLASLNAPTGAWCSLTGGDNSWTPPVHASQCTYRCVVLPDTDGWDNPAVKSSQCTYRCVVLPDLESFLAVLMLFRSQCTYRCVVLPDSTSRS